MSKFAHYLRDDVLGFMLFHPFLNFIILIFNIHICNVYVCIEFVFNASIIFEYVKWHTFFNSL